MRARFAATLYAVIALALAAFAVPAFAGDHGGGGRGHDYQQSSTQQSSDQQSSDQHGGWKHDQGGSQGQASQTASGQDQSGSGGDNSTGVKPSNTTKHDTYAPASSDQTKQYGNGKTAGEIATQAGYGSATLHGPGNSQPHKTSCGGHEVDVHALKAHGGDCGQAPQVEQTNAAQNEQKVKKQNNEQETQKQIEVQQAPQAPAVVQMPHVTICHATGSASHPFVEISPAAAGVYNGHMGHQDARDIIPPFTWNGMTVSQNWDDSGKAIYDAGCVEATQSVQSTEKTQSSNESTQATEENESAEQETQATEESESAPSVATQASPAVVTQAPTVVTQAPTSASGVKGVSVVLKRAKAKPAVRPATKAKAAGGVLGTTSPLHSSITSATLPFTGLPLWPFLLGAVVLIAIGIASRYAAADRRAS